jgi:hypothetical protein
MSSLFLLNFSFAGELIPSACSSSVLGGGKAGGRGGRRRGKRKGRKRKEEDSLIDENPSVRIPFEECLSKT